MEIILAVVLMGLVVSALFASFTTATQASTQTKTLIAADAALRNAAEATKSAVREQCINGATNFTPTFTVPPGFGPPSIGSPACPATSGGSQVTTITLTVTAPNGVQKSLKVGVRSP